MRRSLVAAATATGLLVSTAGLGAAAPPSGPVVAARGWSAPQQVSQGAGWVSEYSTPAAAVNGRGMVATWVQTSDDGARLFASLRGASGEWRTPRQLASAPVPPTTAPSTDGGPGGMFSVVWRQQVDGVAVVQEVHREAGRWSEPVTLGPGRMPDVTVDGDGVTTVAWSHDGLRVARRPADGTWGRPTKLRDGPAQDPVVASNADGAAVVAWLAERDHVMASLRPEGRRWRPPTELGPEHGWSIEAALPANGRALLVWEVGGPYTGKVLWSRSTRAGAWSAPGVVGRHIGEDGGFTGLSVNGGGFGLATWTTTATTSSHPHSWAARFRPDGTWSEPELLAVYPVWEGCDGLPWIDRSRVARVFACNQMFRQAPGGSWSEPRRVLPRFQNAAVVAGDPRSVVVLWYFRALAARVLQP